MPINPLFRKPRTLITTLIFSQAGRTFLVSLALWLLAFTYCRHRFWRDPHSAFFQSEHVYEWKYTDFRRSQGLSFLKTLETQTTPTTKVSENPEICAAFVTIKREKEQYFDGAVGSLLEGLTAAERRKLHLNVLFGDPDPSVHPSWGKEWLGKGFDSWGGYNVSDETHEQLRNWMETKNFIEKGFFDYLYMLNFCYETNAPYILMLEDDIIVADGWFARTLLALQTVETKTTHQHWTNYLFLRLFYTETPLGWDASLDFWYRRLDLLLFLSAAATFISLHLLRRSVPSMRRYGDIWTSLVLSLLTIPAFIILAFMIGKYSLMPLNGVVDLGHKGCCSQALVFSRDRVPALVEWARKRPIKNMDTMLDEYAVDKGMERLAMGKQVVQHVGLMSSRGGRTEDARSGRAFWFEEYDATVLAKEHGELVKDLAGLLNL